MNFFVINRQWNAGITRNWFDQPVLTKVSRRVGESSIKQALVPRSFNGMITPRALLAD
ncbi:MULTISPECIES: hypothetical protein [unclassified Pseudomonas]|uniref:hypothetical protein n=1 Tax=unclassified Pseudomonas TaxID=196821 RepID=UPI001A9367F9|nr:MULTISPECIES: hypothetical protein [unclassified Pseudomonas]